MTARIGAGIVGFMVIALVVFMTGCGGAGNTANTSGGKAKPTTTPYIVTAPEMDDDDCVAEVERDIPKVEGVDQVECDMAKRTVKVYPKQGAEISLRKLWEAFEAIPFDGTKEPKITKIDGPSGVITSKPDK